MITKIQTLGSRGLVSVTDAARHLAEHHMPDGGTILVDKDGNPIIVCPYIPLQVTHLVPPSPSIYVDKSKNGGK